ncbi:MAG TPA: X2-like carbohydrate binding domain-containing protein, partial [Clostridia bacterium]
ISKWYLNYYFTKFPEQNLYLTFNLDNGMSIRFTVYTGSSPYVVLTPDNVSYEMNSVDVKLNLTLNGNYIASIKNGSTSLVQRVDYTYGPSEKILYIRKGFLANYFSKTLMPLNLTVNFTGGESKTVMVTPYTKDLEIHSAYISAEVYNHPYYILFAPGHSDSLNISKEDVTENEKQLDRHFITYVNNGETIKIKSVVEAAYDNSANGFYGKITENNFSKSDDHTFSVLPASASDAKLYFVRKDGMAVQLSTIKESSQGTSYPMSTDCKVIRVTIKYDKSGIDITTLTDIESINKGDKVFCVMVDGLIKAIYFLR